MVERDLPRAVHQHKRRRSAGPIHVEVFIAYRDGNARQSGVIVLPHAFNVGLLSLRCGIISTRGVSVALGGRDDRQLGKFRAQSGQDRRLALAVRAPVRPEEQQ